MSAVIYIMSWKNNSYFYIGQTQNLKIRKKNHISSMKRRKHCNKRVQNVYNKYGAPTIEVLEYCKVEELNEIEQWYLDDVTQNPNCLNVAKCVIAPTRGRPLSEEHKHKLSEASKGKSKSKEHVCKVSEAKKKPVIQYSKNGVFIKEWASAIDAAKKLKLCPHIQSVHVVEECTRLLELSFGNIKTVIHLEAIFSDIA